jgi:hypothetical protein
LRPPHLHKLLTLSTSSGIIATGIAATGIAVTGIAAVGSTVVSFTITCIAVIDRISTASYPTEKTGQDLQRSDSRQ